MAEQRRRLAWITGRPGCGKTTLADYLALQCGFVHIDADEYQFDPSPEMVRISKPWVESWTTYFFKGKGGECPAELWEPYYRHICDQVQKVDKDRDVVVSLSIHRPARDFVRQMLPDIVFIGLTMSLDKNGLRLAHKSDRYDEIMGLPSTNRSLEAKKQIGQRVAKLEVAIDDDEAGSINIDAGDDAAVVPRTREILGLGAATEDAEAVAAAVTAAAEENWKRLAAWQPWRVHGNADVKVTNKKSTAVYVNAARRFLVGTADKDGTELRPYGKITISGLGAAINAVAAVAGAMEKEGLGTVSSVSTDSMDMDSGRTVPQFKVVVTRKG